MHLQLHLRAGLANPLVTLGRAIGAFKSLCAKDFHELTGESGSLWQQGYHDWICMSEEMIAAVNRYIDYNPLKFELRYNQPEFLAIHEPKGRIVQILPSAMPHDFKVGSLWLEAIRDRRAAIIARGNSEIEFSRAACLEVNAASVRVAGKAVYRLPEGPKLVS